MPNDTQLNIRIPVVLKQLIDQEAARRNMSVSRLIRDAVRASILATVDVDVLMSRDQVDAVAARAAYDAVVRRCDEVFGLD